MEQKKRQAPSPQLLLILLVIVATLGASSPTTAKFALASLGPFSLLALRFLFGLVLLLPFAYVKQQLKWSELKHTGWLALIGALNPILLFIALQFTNASFSPLIYGGVPAMTALYMFMFHQQTQSWKTIAGILLGLSGVGLVVLQPVLQSGSIEGASVFGNGLIFLASIAFAGFGILSEKVQKKHDISPLTITVSFALMSLLVCIPFVWYEVGVIGLKAPVELSHLASAIYLGIFSTAIFYLLYQYVIKHSTAVAATVMVYLQPIIGVALAVVLLDEKITASFVIGGILAIAGAQIASRAEVEEK